MEKVVELVGQGFVINGANPSSFNLFGPGGALNQGEEKGDRPNEWMMTMILEQPLAI